MDLERQSESVENYTMKERIREHPARELVAAIKQRLKEKDRRFTTGELRRIAFALIGSLGCIMLLLFEPRPFARAGLTIALVCFPLIAITENRLGRKLRVKQAWLPAMSFLQSELDRFDGEIRLRHVTLLSNAITVLSVGMLFLVARIALATWLGYLCMALVLGSILLWLEKREIGRLLALRARTAEHLNAIARLEDDKNGQ